MISNLKFLIVNDLTGDKCAKNSDCKPGWLCVAGKCHYPSGKVLLKSVVFRGFQALPESQGVTTVLFGEKTHQSPQGVTCDFTLNHSTDIQSHFSEGKISIADEKSLGGCWEVNKTYLKYAILKCNI